MGHRTLSLDLIWRALALHPDAYDELRDDDNPFVEGLFFIVLITAASAVLRLVGQYLAWASTPNLGAVKSVVLDNLLRYFQAQPWWNQAGPNFLSTFQRWYDLGWQVFPALFGAPDPSRAGLDIVLWPLLALLGWLIYGLLAFLFARLFQGQGSLNQTLGTTALAVAPLVLRGLGLIPFLVVGGVINTWILACRYQAVRSAHRLTWSRALWATILPFAVYLVFWFIVGLAAIGLIAGLVGR